MTPCKPLTTMVLLAFLSVLKGLVDRAGCCAGVEGMLTYHLMPRGVPDAETRLQVTALDQVIARLYQQGRVQPHAVAALVLPKEELEAPSPPLPFQRDLPDTTTGMSPERNSGHNTSPYTAANALISSSSSSSSSSYSPAPILPSSPVPTLHSFTTPSTPNSRPTRPTPRIPSSHAPTFLAAASLDSFTLCLWFRVTYFAEFSVLLSYSTHGEGDDALTLGPRLSTFLMEYMGSSRWMVQREVEPHRWYSACILRNGTARRASLFLDGARRLDMDAPTQLNLNGTLVLGNDQDHPGGGFSVSQSVPGSVTGLYLWSRMLSLTEISAVGNCDPPEAVLLPWEAIPWNVVGEVQKEFANPCHQKSTHIHFLLPVKITFQKAHWFCSGHGLALPFPMSKTENDEIVSYIKINVTSCANNYNAAPSTWLDVIYDETNIRWLGGPDHLPVHFSRFQYNSGLHKKHYSYISDSGEWLSTGADDVSCTLCKGTDSHPHVYVYGLCREEEFMEHHTILYPRSDSRGIYYLQGASGLHLRHDSGNRWVLHHVPTNTLVAEYDAANFFWGRKMWMLNGTAAVCGPRRQLFGHHNLTISWCRPGSFTCASGQCVLLTARCSLEAECEDDSDEMDCQLVHTPDDYQTYLPPYSPNLPLNFTILFNKLWSVDLMGQLVHVTFNVHIRWRDGRLTYHNLQDNPSLNIVSITHSQSLFPLGPFHGPVWYPKVQVQDNERLAGEVAPHVQLFIRKISPGVDVKTDYIYSGAENELEYLLEFESNVHCELNLEMYPFDSQWCSITVTVTNVINQAVQYPSLPLDNAHPTLPPHQEFIITSPRLSVQNKSSTARLTFYLHRRPEHHLFSTFLPTVLLHLIGYSSFFLRLDNFQDRSVMSLTTLLALVALYSESLASLPSTSYLKHVDIWFVFSIAFLTAIVVVHIAINDNKTSLTYLPKGPSCPSPSLWQKVLDGFRTRSTNWKLMLGAKVGLGVAYVLFQFVYWGHVLFSR